MSYILSYTARYFGLYLWFTFVLCVIIGIPWSLITTPTGWDAYLDAVVKELPINTAVASGILFVIALAVFSVACKWSLQKTILDDYKSFKISFPKGKIKFSTALLFQAQVTVCSFIAQYIPVIVGLEISELLRVLLDLLVLFVFNYIIIIRWIKQNTIILPKDFGSAS